MKGKRSIFALFFVIFTGFIFAQDETTLEAVSSINWITREFKTNLSLDTQKAKLQMPSGKKTASNQIKSKMPQLTQPALLSLYQDSNTNLSDMVIGELLSLDQVHHFITNGYKTPDVFSSDIKYLKTTNSTNINDLGKLLVRHNFASNPEKPIDSVASRAYSGIIIDARGSYPVHGEYVESEIYPCLFPQIWDEQMNHVFEKNLVNPKTIKEKGLVAYHYSDDISEYEDRIGTDPLYIKAKQVFGRNRTDPVIKQKDALKILTVPENVKLIQEGKVVILLDKKNLVYDIAVPEKNKSYYVKYNTVKQYFYINEVNVDVDDTPIGIRFRINLNFYPDSPELLPSEKNRIAEIAEQLKEILKDDGYTILVEGHTADVGKPVGQLNLSNERTETVMNALINEGLDKGIFTYRGYGGTMPIDTNETEEGRARNRRVEIFARPRATYIQRDY